MASTKPKHFIIDVDGVLTTGQFLYTKDGKFAKIFGPHDNDGIKMIKNKIKVLAISADKRGWAITKKRVEDDMGVPLTYLPEEKRVDWFKKNFNLNEVIYMGDGIFDAQIFKEVFYSIAPHNAFYLAKRKADFVTQTNAAEGAVAEACVHILEKFFKEV